MDMYDTLYAEGQKVVNHYNPCKFSEGKCLAGSHCCGGCVNLGPNGCTTDALACKLFLCWDARSRPDGAKAEAQLQVLRTIAHEHKVPMRFFVSKQQAFEGKGHPA